MPAPTQTVNVNLSALACNFPIPPVVGFETLGGSTTGSGLGFSSAGGSAAAFGAGLLAAAGTAGFDASLLVAVGAAGFLAAVGGATGFHPAGLDGGDVDNADNGSVFGGIMNKNAFQ